MCDVIYGRQLRSIFKISDSVAMGAYMLVLLIPEQLLHEIEVEQNFCVSYVHVDEKSKDGKCLCFVQLGTSPVVVCLGSADVPEMAQRESCRNALEYLRVMTKS